MKVCRANSKDPGFEGFAPSVGTKKVSCLSKELMSYSSDDIVRYLSDFSDRLKSVNEELSVRTSSFRKTILKKRIINSEGIDLEEKYAYNTADFDPIIFKDLSIGYGDFQNKPLDPERAVGFGERVLSLQDKKHVKTKEMQLALHPEAIGDLLDGFIESAFSAENVQKKKSAIFGNLGNKMFSDSLSIYDDASKNDFMFSRSFDDEGSPSKRVDLIKSGNAKDLLYDNYTARKIGKLSTGNASRSASSRPEISTTNLFVEKGTEKDPVGQIKDGLYVKGLIGVHTMNLETGDFSLGVSEGHYVKDGELMFPVKDTMISGNLLNLLNNISAIGKEVEHSAAAAGGVYAPIMLFDKVQVIGQK